MIDDDVRRPMKFFLARSTRVPLSHGGEERVTAFHGLSRAAEMHGFRGYYYEITSIPALARPCPYTADTARRRTWVTRARKRLTGMWMRESSGGVARRGKARFACTSCDRASLARVTGGSCRRFVRFIVFVKREKRRRGRGRGKTVPGEREGGGRWRAGYIAYNGPKWPNYRTNFECVSAGSRKSDGAGG